MPQLTMPNVGEGVTEGTVVRWIKREGERVALDEPVVEIETDKAVVEIPSPYAGRLVRVLVQEGDVVPIGTPLAEFDGVDAEAAASGEPQAAHEDEAAAPVASRSAPSGVSTAAADGPATAGSQPAMMNGAGAPRDRRNRQYSPVVLKLADEHGIDLSLVLGTGIDGRVTRKDVLRYIENPAAYTAPPPPSAGVVGVEAGAAKPARTAPVDVGLPGQARGAASMDAASADAGGRIEPLSPTRRTIARRMAESHSTIPGAWMAVEADVTGLVALRGELRSRFEDGEGVKLTYMPFFVQAIVVALKEHPRLNATYGDEGITIHRRLDIGIAIATEHGLVVPVVRDADDLNLSGLARRIDALAEKARVRKLGIDDMRGATFTIDNTGAFGSIISQPIIPVGQAAIITTEAIRRDVRAIDGGMIGVRSVMNLCISFDHRALDGADAGAFMRTVRERLEAYAPGLSVY